MNKLFIYSLCIFFIGCSPEKNKPKVPVAVTDIIISKTDPDKGIVLHQLKKLFVIGDFDGDHQPDTIFQHLFSYTENKEIDSVADPFQNDRDDVINWFSDRNAGVCLTLNHSHDTLHAGGGQGLYCLINIGDVNADGRDEIALVVDRLDISRVNTCAIYTRCGNKWAELKGFSIHEDAFNFTDTIPVFKDIPAYLEKKGNKWFYLDYSNNDYDRPEDVGKMKLLKVSKCK